MILTALPNPELFVKDGQDAQTQNTVLYAATTKRYSYPAHETPYLFAINFLNKGGYSVNGQRVQLSEKCFYFLNPGDELAINFRDEQPLKTLFIFFNELFVDDSISAITASPGELLDDPFFSPEKKIKIPNVPFGSEKVLSYLFQLLAPVRLNQELLDSLLFEIIEIVFKLNKDLSLDLSKINAVRKSTREELYKRLFIAHEFMEDNGLQNRLSIEEVAAIACMNKFHFLASFKDFYGITPHQYMINLKLQKAFELLKGKQVSVAETCYAIGFDSPSTFSTLFKGKFGVSPSILLSE